MNETEYKKVTVVDEADNVIGAEYLLVAKEKGLLRRAARVFVFDKNGRLLLQRRSSKVFNPNLLDQSVGGHVDEGESYLEAAERELMEELNLAQ
jgi:isopentenyl-diphosphate delta-isomerase